MVESVSFLDSYALSPTVSLSTSAKMVIDAVSKTTSVLIVGVNLSKNRKPIEATVIMTRVEGENILLQHYLARLHRKTLCYSKSLDMFKHAIRLLIHYLKFGDVSVLVRFIP